MRTALFLAIFSTVLIGTTEVPALAQAQWQPISSSPGYTYFVSGNTTAYPIYVQGVNGLTHYIKERGADDSKWFFKIPVSQDPQTNAVIYRILYTDGSNVWERYSHWPANAPYTQWQAVDLKTWEAHRDTTYKNLIAAQEKKLAAVPYYDSQYFQADRLFKAVYQIALRQSQQGR